MRKVRLGRPENSLVTSSHPNRSYVTNSNGHAMAKAERKTTVIPYIFVSGFLLSCLLWCAFFGSPEMRLWVKWATSSTIKLGKSFMPRVACVPSFHSFCFPLSTTRTFISRMSCVRVEMNESICERVEWIFHVSPMGNEHSLKQLHVIDEEDESNYYDMTDSMQ